MFFHCIYHRSLLQNVKTKDSIRTCAKHHHARKPADPETTHVQYQVLKLKTSAPGTHSYRYQLKILGITKYNVSGCSFVHGHDNDHLRHLVHDEQSPLLDSGGIMPMS